MSTIDVPFQDYVRGVRASGPSALVLAARLRKAAPADLLPDERAALVALEGSADSVREVLATRDRVGPARLRPLLVSQTSTWGALHDALAAKAQIPVDVSDVGVRAQAVVGSLFPDGMSFLQLPAEGAWAEADRRIQRVTDEKLKKEIGELVGPEFLVAATRSTAALGDAIGTGESPRPLPPSTALQDELAHFGRGVGVYARVLAAHCDETDPESVRRFREAVAPLDLHRSQARSGSPTAAPAASVQTDPVQVDPAHVQADATPAVHTAPAIGITADHVTVTQSSVGTIAAPTSTVAPVRGANGAANGTPSTAANVALNGGAAAA